ncbi:MAG: DUF4173 domain-containing protein [Bacteroidia bacterium]
MKKTMYALIAFSASYLFFEQSLGLNTLIFSLLILLITFLDKNEDKKLSTFLLTSIVLLASSVSVFLYSNFLSILAFWLALFVHISFVHDKKLSFVTGCLSTFINVLASVVYFVEKITEKMMKSKPNSKKKEKYGVLAYIVPLILVVVFFLFYRSINEDFKNLTDKINLDFISWPWLWFTLLCFVLVFPLFHYQKFQFLSNFESRFPKLVSRPITNSFFNMLMNLRTEYMAAIISFVALNILLLTVNFLDIAYLYLKIKGSAQMSMSESVHHGVGNLIWSVIFAIAVVLLFYRGRVNFLSSKVLFALASLWVIQNAFLVFSTAYRNYLYVENWGLTYKRIGVFIYLFLTIIGLAITLVKIKNRINNWHLIRQFNWSAFVFLVVCSLINWNKLVVGSQVSVSKKFNRPVDCNYLYSLSPTSFTYIGKNSDCDELDERFIVKSQNFIKEYNRRDWQSFVWRDYITYHKLNTP